MKKHLHRRAPVSLAFECLESRLPLAGNITAVVSGSTLKITGDLEANQVTLATDAADNTKFAITSNSGTINTNLAIGQQFTTPAGVKNIVINLLDGDDRVDIVSGATPVTVPGNLTINGGDGANAIDAVDLTVQKNLTVTNGTNDAGFDNPEFVNLNVGGNVTIKNGDGNSQTEIFRSTAGDSTIAGDLSITNGVGEDYNYLIDTNVNRNVTVKNGKGAANGTAGETQIYNEENTTARSVIGGNVKVSYVDGNGAGGEQDGIWDYEVQKNVTFDHGKGDFRTDFEGFSVTQPVLIKGNLTVKGKGAQTVVTGQVYEQTGLVVEKNFSVTSSGGADLVSLDKSQTLGKVTLKLGDGENRVEIVAGGDSTAKSFSFTGGKEKDVVEFAAQLVAQSLTLDLKDGANEILSTVGIAADAGNTFGTKLTVKTGQGDDQINFTNVLATSATFNLGNGANTITADEAIVGKMTYKGGNGVDSLNVFDAQFDDFIASLLGGDDLLAATDTVFQNSITIDGGAGTDTVTQTNVTLPANPAKIKIKNVE